MIALYVSSSSFKVLGNKTTEFTQGRRVKVNCGVDGLKYSSVINSSYDGSTYTTVNIDESDLTSNINDVLYGMIQTGPTGTMPDHDHSGYEGSGGVLYGGSGFIGLYDTPTTYSGSEGKYLRTTSSGVEFADVSIASSFLDLTDTPTTYSGSEDKFLKVTSSGIEFAEVGTSNVGNFLDLTDTPTTYSGSEGKYLRTTASGVEFADVSIASNFLDLTDTPTTYSGFEGSYLRVTASGVEFSDVDQDLVLSNFKAYEEVVTWDLSNETLDQTISWDGDTDDRIYVECTLSNPSADGPTNLLVQFNGSTTGYHDSYIIEYNDNPYAGYDESATTYPGLRFCTIIKTTDTNEQTFSTANFYLKSGGRRHVIATMSESDSIDASYHSRFYTGSWNNTADNITSIRFYSDNSSNITGTVKVYKFKKVTLPNQRYSADGIQSVQVTYKDADEIYINPGTVHIVGDTTNDLYQVETQLTKQLTSLSADTWYYIYVKPPGSGLTLSATEIEYSTTAPTEDTSKNGYYHPTNTNWRCIFAVYSDSSTNIYEFSNVSNSIHWPSFLDHTDDTPSSVWTDQVLTVPLFGDNTVAKIRFDGLYSNAGSTAAYRTNGTDSEGIALFYLQSAAPRSAVITDVVCDSSGIIETKWTNSNSNAIRIYNIGFVIPDKVYTGSTQIKPKNVFARGMQSLEVLYKDADEIYINPGTVHIKTSTTEEYYTVYNQITKQLSGLTTDTFYYIYVSPPETGYMLSSTDIQYSSTAPSKDLAKMGWYHPTNTSWRCIMAAYVDESGNLYQWYNARDRIIYDASYPTVSNAVHSSTWTSYSQLIPIFEDNTVSILHVYLVRGDGSLTYRVRKPGSTSEGIRVGSLVTSSARCSVTIDVPTDDTGSVEGKWSGTTSNAVYMFTNGFILPTGMFTGPAYLGGSGGYDNMLDEDDFASNSDTNTASQQSIKAYVDATVSGVGSGSSAFLELTDTPSVYVSGKYLQTTSSGIEFIAPPSVGSSTFLDLTDTPTTYSGVSGKYVISTSSGVEFTDIISGTSMYIDGDATVTGTVHASAYDSLSPLVLKAGGSTVATGDDITSVVDFTHTPTVSGTVHLATESYVGSNYIPITDLLDEDNFVSDDPNKPASQQSIKAYVDATVSGVGSSSSTFLELTDTPSVYESGKYLQTTSSGVEFIAPPSAGSSTFLDLTDTPTTYSGFEGSYLRATTSGIEFSNVDQDLVLSNFKADEIVVEWEFSNETVNETLSNWVGDTDSQLYVEITGTSSSNTTVGVKLNNVADDYYTGYLGDHNDTPVGTYYETGGKSNMVLGYIPAGSYITGYSKLNIKSGGWRSVISNTQLLDTVDATWHYLIYHSGWDNTVDEITSLNFVSDNTFTGTIKVYKRKQIVMPNQRYSADGIQSIQVTYKDADEIYINPGTVHIVGDTTNDLYQVESQLTKQLTSLSTDTWYYIYVKPPGSGLTLSSSEIEYSTTVPTEDTSKNGFYHGTNTNWRCIGVVRTDGSSNIKGWTVVGNEFKWDDWIVEQATGQSPYGANNWGDFTSTVPFNIEQLSPMHFRFVYGSSGTVYYRVNGSSGSGMVLGDCVSGDYNSFHKKIIVDESGIYELKSNTAGPNMTIQTEGFLLPDKVYTGATQIKPKNVFARGVQSLKVEYKDADEIYINPGTIHIKTDTSEEYYTVYSQLTKQLTGLSTDTWYYIYVDPPDSGYMLTSTDIEYSTTAPTLNLTKLGWYHPTNTDQRCIFAIYSDSSSNIYEWRLNNNDVFYTEYIVSDAFPIAPSTTWTDVTLTTPLFGDKTITIARIYGIYVSTTSVIQYRVNGSTGAGYDLATIASSSSRGHSVQGFPTDSAGKIELRYSIASSSQIYVWSAGYSLPDYMYTGPAYLGGSGGYDNMLDEDDFASNSDTNTASQQSIKAYVDATVSGVGSGSSTFLELTDTPSSYVSGKYLQTTSSGIEFIAPPSAGTSTFLDLTDTPSSYNVGKYAVSTTSGIEFTDTISGTSMYINGDATVTGTVYASAYDSLSPLVLKAGGTTVVTGDDVTGIIDFTHIPIVSGTVQLATESYVGSNYIPITDLLDEDDFASNSDTNTASQQSIKAYVDATVSGVGSSSSTFLELTDTPSVYESGKYLQTTSSGLEFIDPPSAGSSAFLDLTDTPTTYSGFEGSYLRATASGIEFSNVDQDLVLSNFKAYEIYNERSFNEETPDYSFTWDGDIDKDIRIVVKGGTLGTSLLLQFNGDTNNNYYTGYITQDGSTPYTSYAGAGNGLHLTSAGTDLYSVSDVTLNTGYKKQYFCIGSNYSSTNTDFLSIRRAGYWNNTTKVTSIRIFGSAAFTGTIEIHKFKQIVIPNQRYSADGIQSIQVTYKDADEIYVNPGTVSIIGDSTNDLYQVETQITKQLTSLSPSTWYYIYVKPSGSGLIIAANEIEYSSVVPTEDVAKNGFYHPTNTNWRCIFAVYSDSSSNIKEWWNDSNVIRYLEDIQDVTDLAPSTTWTDVTLTTPLFSDKNITVINFYAMYVNVNAGLYYRPNGDTSNGLLITAVRSEATRNPTIVNVKSDSAGIIEVSWGVSTSDTINIHNMGFVLPDNVYTGSTQIKPKNVFARGIQSLKVEYKDADEIYINPGTIHIKTDTSEEYYTVYNQLTKQLTGLSTDTWYYIYVDPPDSGYMLTAADIEYSTIAPTRNLTKLGWYHGTNTDWRCIGVQRTDGSGNLIPYTISGDRISFDYNWVDANSITPSTTWTEVTFTVPAIASSVMCRTNVTYVNANTDAWYRVKSTSTTYRIFGYADSGNFKANVLDGTFELDNGTGWVRFSSATTNQIYLQTYGYTLSDYMYTGPAYLGGSGGYDNMLDEDDFASNSDTNTASQQSIKAYVDATVSGVGSGSSTFLELTDTPSVYESGKYLQTTSSGIEFIAPPSAGSSTFLELTDTPSSYNAGKYVVSTTSGIEFISTLSGTGMYIDGDATVTGTVYASTYDSLSPLVLKAGGSTVATGDDITSVVDFTHIPTVSGTVQLATESYVGSNYIPITDLLDEDDFASNSDTNTASQQSIKAYVDATVSGVGSGSSTFLELTDTPSVYESGKYLQTTLSGIEFIDPPSAGSSAFLDLTDTPTTYSGFEGSYLRATASGIEFSNVDQDLVLSNFKAYEEVVSWTVSNAALDQTITWDGDTDDRLYVEFTAKNPSAICSILAQFNSVTTGYHECYITEYNDTMYATYDNAGTAKSGLIFGYVGNTADTDEQTFGVANFYLKSGGRRHVISNTSVSDSIDTSYHSLIYTSSWNNTVDNITSIRFYTSATIESGTFKVYKFKKVTLPNQRYSADGIQSIQVTYKDADEIYINPGTVHIVGDTTNDLYQVESQLTKQLTSLSVNTWYYIYVKPPGDGLILSASEVEYSTTAPTEDTSKNGFYHGTNTNWRCIFAVLVDSSGNIKEFRNDNYNIIWDEYILELAGLQPSNVWTDQVITVPLIGNNPVVKLSVRAQYSNTINSYLYYRTNGSNSSGIKIARVTDSSKYAIVSQNFICDSSGIIEFSYDSSTNNYVDIYNNGFVLPSNMYTGSTQIKPKNIFARGIQSLKVEYKDADEIYINPGTIHIKTDTSEEYYTVYSQLTKQLTGLSIDTWYYIYVDPPDSGYMLTAQDIEYSTTAPTRNLTKLGWYHPTNTDWRCITAIRTVEGGTDINPFEVSGNKWRYTKRAEHGFRIINDGATSYTAIDADLPFPALGSFQVYSYSAQDRFFSIDGITDYWVSYSTDRLSTEVDFPVNSNLQIYYKVDTNTIVVYVLGYELPEYMYTGPAYIGGVGGYDNMLDEDNFASNSDTNTASQQSIKAYVDATVSGVGSGSSTFLELTDTPSVYESGKYLQTTSSGIEFIAPPSVGSSTFLDLTDTPTTYSGVSGKYLQTTSSGIEFIDPNIIKVYNPNVTTGIEVIDTFSDTIADGCMWDFVIKKGTTDLRVGTIQAGWIALTNEVTSNEFSTTSIGDTSDLSFDVDISSDNVRLLATVSGTWAIKISRRLI